MANKLFDVLKELLPKEQVNEVASVIESMIADARKELETEFNDKLVEAYKELTEEIEKAEKTGYEGYQEAFGIIEGLRNRLEAQKEEFDTAMEEQYGEAFKILEAEKAKNSTLEVELYENMTKKVEESETYLVEMVHKFLKEKGAEIYNEAKRDIMNDPRMVEHKVVLDKVVEHISDYLSDDNYSAVTSGKVSDLGKKVDELKGQLKIAEARNIRLDTDNKKVSRDLREAYEALKERETVLVENEKKVVARKAQEVTARGQKIVLEVNEHIIPEGKDKAPPKENLNENAMHDIRVLAGLAKSN